MRGSREDDVNQMNMTRKLTTINSNRIGVTSKEKTQKNSMKTLCGFR